jgi:lipid A 4'-phosphatase
MYRDGVAMSKNFFILSLVLTLLFSIIFLTYPNIDITVSSMFYSHQAGFLLAHAQWADMARTFLYRLVWVVSAILIVLLLLKFIKPHLKYNKKPLIYAITVLILVPLLFVNALLKNEVGRPRPENITVFSGTKIFQPVYKISDQCATNCSFVCGDTSTVFAFWLFLPFFRKRYQKTLYGGFIFLAGCFYGYIRIGQGGHFLSDVIFSCLYSYISIYIIWWFFYRFRQSTEASKLPS